MTTNRYAIWHYSRLVIVVMRVSVTVEVRVSMWLVGATMRVPFCNQAEHPDESKPDDHEEQLD